MPSCCVPGCSHGSNRKRTNGLSYHRFPRDVKQIKAWLSRVRNKDLDPKLASSLNLKNWRICGRHFTPDDYEPDLHHAILPELYKPKHILKKDSIPSIFSFKPTAAKRNSRAVEKQEALRKRQSVNEILKEASSRKLPLKQTRRKKSKTRTNKSQTPAELAQTPTTSTSVIPCTVDYTESHQQSDANNVASEAQSSTETDTHNLLANEDLLLSLFKRCQVCGEKIETVRQSYEEAVVRIYWKCAGSHEGVWCNSNEMCGIAEIDLKIAVTNVLTGVAFNDIADFMKLLNVPYISHATFQQIKSAHEKNNAQEP